MTSNPGMTTTVREFFGLPFLTQIRVLIESNRIPLVSLSAESLEAAIDEVTLICW